MSKKPIETIVYTVSLYETSVHVKAAYYEDGRLSASSGQVVPIPRESREWKRRLTDLFHVEDQVVKAVRAWLDQLVMF